MLYMTLQSDIHNNVMTNTQQLTITGADIFTKFNKSATDFTSI